MREWGAEALTSLIKAGLTFNHDPPLSQNQVKERTFFKITLSHPLPYVTLFVGRGSLTEG